MRHTARAILVNKKIRKILLIKYIDIESMSTKDFVDGFWALPGGGIKKSETFLKALKREIYEETGITQVDVKNCVLSRITYLDIATTANKYYYERYYLVETNEINTTAKNLTSNETKVIKKYKWWSQQEIKKTKEVILPKSFTHYVEKIFEKNSVPIDITDADEILKNSPIL